VPGLGFQRLPGTPQKNPAVGRNVEYAIDVLQVQEIRAYEPPTPVANAPHFVRGVVNLRGVIMPVVDLRLKLACARAACDSLTAVIVLQVHGRVVGIVVDSVSDVLELGRAQIRPAGGPNLCPDAHFVTAVGTVSDGDAERTLRLMDIEALLGSADLGLADRRAAG